MPCLPNRSPGRAAATCALLTFALAASSIAADAPKAAASGASAASAADLERLLERFKAAQASTRTMTAAFRVVKEDDLLAAPDVRSGRLFYTQPTGFRWDYQVPEVSVVLMDDERIQRWIPAERVVRESKVTRGKRRAFNLFGIGSDIDAMRQHFAIAWDRSDAARAGADRIDLTPRRKRVRSRIQGLHMWIDRETSLPVVVQLVSGDGGSTTWEFTDVAVNPDLPKDTHVLRVPRGTRVQADDGSRSVHLEDVIAEEDVTPSGTAARVAAAAGPAPASR